MITASRAPEEKLATVSELAERLAERALAEMMQQRPVEDQTATALAEAVLLLRDYDYPVPPLALECLTRFFRDRREHAAADQDSSREQEPDSEAHEEQGEPTAGGKLMGLFRSLRPGA
ncbi:hypothetical protein [Methylobacterium nigriterrae]|uniref:hypothetical protein n=1 Tax=Methylobacterium nigriterrae TaxID=3127512 RepID=UPI0030139DAF